MRNGCKRSGTWSTCYNNDRSVSNRGYSLIFRHNNLEARNDIRIEQPRIYLMNDLDPTDLCTPKFGLMHRGNKGQLRTLLIRHRSKIRRRQLDVQGGTRTVSRCKSFRRLSRPTCYSYPQRRRATLLCLILQVTELLRILTE